MQRLTLAIGAVAFLVAVGVVSYVALTSQGPTADTALGAVIALVSAGGSYFLRGRVQNPDAGTVTLSAEAPATATLRSAPTALTAAATSGMPTESTRLRREPPS